MGEMPSSLRDRIDADLDRLKSIRRDLHMHPELMYEEHRTSSRVAEELESLGIEFKGGLAKGTGILGWLPATSNADSAKTIAIRADMDALPIQEETGAAYASTTDGKMHACGHDGHTTILLGVSKALAAEEQRQNNVILLFQPAEEGGAGGKAMCEDGALDGTAIGKKVDVIYGLHGHPQRELGKFSTKPGALMASTDQFYVTVKGKGGHAAMPETTVDPIIATAHIVTALQSIVSRNVAPYEAAVLTVTQIKGGTANNIIPGDVYFDGTIRTVDPEVRATMKKRFLDCANGVAAALGVELELDWQEGYPVTMNDEWAVNRFSDIATGLAGPERVGVEADAKMGAEDFAYYGDHARAAFYFIGLQKPGDDKPAGLHTPKFDFNDDVIPDCVEMMCRLALEPINLP
jgi:amidohydrolase